MKYHDRTLNSLSLNTGIAMVVQPCDYTTTELHFKTVSFMVAYI